MKKLPYDSLYLRFMQLSGKIQRDVLQFASYEDNAIVSFVGAQENSNVLDYGCNHGRHAEIIKKEYGCNVYGTDINPEAISETNKKDIPAELINSRFFIKYASFFDTILLSHVLEHTQNPKELLNMIHKLLKNNGSFVVVIPQERIRGDIAILQIIYFLFRLRFENPHKHKFSREQLFKLLRETGFVPEQYIYSNFICPYLSKKRFFLTSRSLIVKCIKSIS